MQTIKTMTGNSRSAPVLLVGTHADAVPETRAAEVEQLVEELESIYHRQWFHGMSGVVTVSCKSGAGMVRFKQLLLKCGRDVRRQMPQVPMSWVALHDHIESQRADVETSQSSSRTKASPLRLSGKKAIRGSGSHADRNRPLLFDKAKQSMSWEEFESTAEDVGITSTDGMREAASFLHSIGALFYCRQEGRELVILNPQVRGVYKGKERL